ncbi:MAG: hypothetical protein K0S20_361 [Patescibacteria group bacterium]|jgi:hypothetical protein|nr:hypothetical protein [Patescibacteria group bacterium]
MRFSIYQYLVATPDLIVTHSVELILKELNHTCLCMSNFWKNLFVQTYLLLLAKRLASLSI